MKVCLQCDKDISARRETAKFCSDNCKVKWNRKNGKANVSKVQMQVLYNQILEVVGKIGQFNNLPPSSQLIIEQRKTEKKTSWDEMPNNNLPTFQSLLNDMAGLQFADEKEDYAEKIKKATNLSEKQINLLLTSLWAKQ